MSASAPAPSPQKKPRGAWFKVRVVIAAVLVFAAFLVYLNGRNQAPPRVLAVLSQGRAYLDVPVMTFYTPSDFGAPNLLTVTNYSFAASSRLSFAWFGVSGASLPVRFVLTSSGPFLVDASGGFTFSPTTMGLGTGATDYYPGAQAAQVAHWVMDYTVRELAVYDWLGEDRWIEVDYDLASPSGCLCNLPTANTSAPLPADLAPVGIPVNLTVDNGILWSYEVSVDTAPLPVTVFHHALPSLRFSLGGLGNISATLTSTFQWGPGADYVMRMSGTGPANVSFQVYLDTRFGSLLMEPLA